MSPAPRHRSGTLAGVLVLALTASACSVANTDRSSVTDPDTLRIVLSQEPPTLEACDVSQTSIGVVTRSNITEPLMERNPTTGDLEPKLADSWEQNSDRQWTFRLHPGVTFSDGRPFEAADAAHSIERTVNSDIGCNVEGYVFGDADLTVAVVDPLTLTVAAPNPDPILPLRISFVEMVPRTASITEREREPVGTGPFALDTWDYGQRLTLVRNDRYWGPRPEFARAVYQWRSEGSIRASMVSGDEADIATGIGPEDGAGDLGVAYPNNETTAVRIQVGEPPLDDIRVRQAINYSINRNGIVHALFRDLGRPAAQLVSPGVVGYDDDLEAWPYDTEKARALLDEARADGVPVDAKIRLIGRTGQFPKVNETLEVVQNALSELGMNISIEMMDSAGTSQYQERPFPADAGPYLLVIQHGNQAGDSAFTVDQYFTSDGFQSAYGTPEFDAEIAAAGQLTGDARQDAYARLFEEEPTKIMQMAYIAHMEGVLAKSDRVDYTPDSATVDEMHLAAMTHADDESNATGR
ncbi:peptide ABC transporter substrate-binding protein [Rhodococcus sp. BP-149]|jgi:peptide/nickel transport system substrate-binding protein|uniref:ABC transporter substrate-binding protein n=1 Tax=unclassified Rhodococcus (in: high G+C Gram-positive bacteria) TaxID=192944 RepID=UPI001C9AC56B|nr:MULTISPECIES: ABC transporter substrate-binding protein [unclassified Rhodococcus (in: high G+C Gram-positive bacteria)]MBY6684682.1 peptide ABC transporter substrate-binding protein [Rhodococcus sp. BP-288]MBY6692834.1 peptide ABC transporter substrate-binding protein [Rhodococcus sp. BP-188]MBY6698732.1 peptide ABC transporter substrate-binding protein [Rhodococcus sp. BP-285]MBY6701411.1 peptide ABC transporter substrate-binding protein [Rhodococcus sp. BP-283]MBY6712412.1 peptide ABC tr